MLKLTESTPGFVLNYPTWVTVLCVGVALAVAYARVWRSLESTQRRSGWGLMVIMLTLFALYFGSYQARFNDTGASLYAFIRYDLKVDWRDVRSVRLERAPNRGRVGHVLIIVTASGELEFNISDLDDTGLHRLMPYIEAQIVGRPNQQ